MFTGKANQEIAHNSHHVQEPQSAHATPVAEQYVEMRKEKAKAQATQERQKATVAASEWKRLEYVIF